MHIIKDKNEHSWGAACHLASFAGFILPFGNILGPLVAWMSKKESSDFVDDQGKESLNFQISFMIYEMVVWIVVCFALFPAMFVGGFGMQMMGGLFPLMGLTILVGIIKLILIIMASISAAQGQKFRYPFTIRFIK